MLFNSYIFILVFLPLVALAYYWRGLQFKKNSGFYVLIFASLIFYAYWDLVYLPLIIISVIFNYFLARLIREIYWFRKLLYIFGIIANLACLGYYKYTNFILEDVFGGQLLSVDDIVLPLAISFFTFQQISYLSDCYFDKVRNYNLVEYSVYVLFFPQLIAGPIVHHYDVMDQFLRRPWLSVDSDIINKGVLLFSFGLFKKVIIADNLSYFVLRGYESAADLNLIESWLLMLSYSFQLYFDFSGYADMAVGLGLIFGIALPRNFNSPYKSLNIQEFWRRWHMTLSRFLRDYIYIPLGGSGDSIIITYRNLIIVFLLGGIWHGAGWQFIIWGLIHGLGIVLFLFWRDRIKLALPKFISWALTFLYVSVAWVFFRAESVSDAVMILNAALSFDNLVLPTQLYPYLEGLERLPFSDVRFEFSWLKSIGGNTYEIFTLISVCFVLIFMPSAHYFILESTRYKGLNSVSAGLAFVVAVASLNEFSEFLYFQF